MIELVPSVGDLLVEGDPLFRVHGGSPMEEETLQVSIAVGDERTMRQDPAFAFRLLADISAKALSPGVNDPTSSSQALDQIEVLLRILGRRRLTPGVLHDSTGSLRFVWPAPSWEDYLSLALDETRHFGEGSVQISRRLTALLEHLLAAVPPYRRPAVEAKLALVGASGQRGFSDDPDRAAAVTSDPQGIGSSRRRRDDSSSTTRGELEQPSSPSHDNGVPPTKAPEKPGNCSTPDRVIEEAVRREFTCATRARSR